MSELLAQNAQLFRGVAAIATEHVFSRPEPQFMPETPVQPIGPYIARHRSTETVSLRERFIRSDFGRSALRVVVAAGLIGGPVLANAVPAAADTQEYTITDDAAGGIYSRNSPHTDDTPRIVGKGVYPGDKVRLYVALQTVIQSAHITTERGIRLLTKAAQDRVKFGRMTTYLIRRIRPMNWHQVNVIAMIRRSPQTTLRQTLRVAITT
jgi:hypothetical protein